MVSKFCVSLVIAIVFSVFYPFFALSQVSGIVVDFQTGKPLPFAAVTYNDAKNGVITDFNGKFEITDKNVKFLKVSYIGYHTKYLPNLDSVGFFIVKLKRKEVNLEEITVFPGENPAKRIIKMAIRNRKLNNPFKNSSFSYTAYNKFIITIDEEDAIRNDSILMINGQLDTSKNDGRYSGFSDFIENQHFFITESLVKRYFRYPDDDVSKVVATRTSGFSDPIFTMLSTDLQSFSFYDDFIKITDWTYLNPVSWRGLNKYIFIITDTIFVKNSDTVFVISYFPKKNKNFNALKGVLNINTNKYAIESVTAEPFDTTLLFGVKIKQEYDFIDNKQWFPVRLFSELYFKNLIMAQTDSISLPLIGRGVSYISDIKINADIDRKIFGQRGIVVEQDSQNDSLLDIYRAQHFDRRDLRTYKVIDSVSEVVGLDRKLNFFMRLADGYLPWGYFKIPLFGIVDYNYFEGFRLGMGLYTSEKLSDNFEVGGYAAYAFGDKRMKYGASASVYSSNDNIGLTFSYFNDVCEAGTIDFFSDFDDLTSEIYRQYLINDMYYSKNLSADFYFRFPKHFSLSASVSYSSDFTPNYEFTPLHTSVFDIFEMKLRMRFVYAEKFFSLPDTKFSMGSDYPVVFLNYTRSLKMYNADFDYLKLDAQVSDKIYIDGRFELKYLVNAGYSSGSLPYYKLFGFNGLYTGSFDIFVSNSFSTMRFREFYASKYISSFMTLDLGRFGKLNSGFSPKVWLQCNVAFGQLEDTRFHSGVNLKAPEKGYYEAGFVIHEIINHPFFNIGLGFFYRLGAYSYPDFRDNYAIRLTFNPNF